MLFDLVQFLMIDKESKGAVTLDVALTTLCEKYGRRDVKATLEAIYGTQVGSVWTCLAASQPHQLPAPWCTICCNERQRLQGLA